MMYNTINTGISDPYQNSISFDAQGPLVKITKVMLFTTRTDYQSPWQRTYDIEASAGMLNKFQNLLAQRGKDSHINPHAAASYIPEIINLQARPTGMANIPNGWGTERLRFIIVAENDGLTGTKRISYIQGYTEFSDLSQNGLIDPNMIFYINSITNTTTTLDRVNNRLWTTPGSTFNVVTDALGNSTYQMEMGDPFDLPKLARPKDIVENAMTLEMHNPVSGRVINASGALGQNTADTSSRTNGDPLQYFSKLYNCFIDGKINTSYSSDANDPTAILRNAADMHTVLESNLLAQPFVKAIHRVTGEICPTNFTLGTLLIMDPTINTNEIVVVRKDYRSQQPTNLPMNNGLLDMMTMSSDTANTLNPTAENLKAVMLCNSINSMMLENLITRASVSMTNMTGENTVIISDVNSFIPDIDLIRWTNRLYSSLLNILMPKITDGGLTIVDIHFMTDVISDTTVAISLNHGPVYLYRFPTFADSLYTPTVTTTANKALLTESFQTLCDATYI